MARRRKRFGAGESRPEESRPTESRPTESRPTESRLTEIRPTEIRPTEIRPTEIRPTEIRPTEIRPTEIRPTEIRPTEIRPTEIRPTEIRPTEIRPTEIRPTESRPTDSRPTEIRPTESRPTESRPTKSRPTESRPTESRPRAGEGQSNDIPNNAIINENANETTPENPSNGRKQVRVVNGLLDKSSECSREITKIFKERIDEKGFTWTKVSQTTKNFYFGEFKKHFVWDPETETIVRKAWDAKASGCYADFFRDIRAKMVKPVFMSDSAWANFTNHWATSKYKEIQEKNTQNRLKGEGSSTHTGGSISFHEHANNLESKYKRPPTRFELFLHTHTSGNDKITFINQKSKTIHDNVLCLREERGGGNKASESQSRVDETALYIEAASGANKRKLYGAGSKRVDYIKDKESVNETIGIAKVKDGLEKKTMKMEKKLKKLNKTLEIVCERFNITLPDCDSDSESENADGGDAHQGTNTSNSRAGESNSQAR